MEVVDRCGDIFMKKSTVFMGAKIEAFSFITMMFTHALDGLHGHLGRMCRLRQDMP